MTSVGTEAAGTVVPGFCAERVVLGGHEVPIDVCAPGAASCPFAGGGADGAGVPRTAAGGANGGTGTVELLPVTAGVWDCAGIPIDAVKMTAMSALRPCFIVVPPRR